MKRSHTQLPTYRVSAFILTLFLLFLAPAANAITKHLSITGSDGQPMPSTTITITFPDGSTKIKEDTDDKGILMFDFKKSGVYTLSDPAGNVIRTVSVTGSGMNAKVMTMTALGAAAVILLAAGSSSSDSSSSDSGAGDTGNGDTGTGDAGNGGTGTTEPPVTEGGGTEASQSGTYDVNLNVASNPGDHPVLLQQLVLQLQIIGTALTIIQLSSNPNFPQQLSGTIADGSFSATANGVYSGFPTLFQIAGTIVALQTLNFILTVGANGSLPGGQPITYNGTGTKQ